MFKDNEIIRRLEAIEQKIGSLEQAIKDTPHTAEEITSAAVTLISGLMALGEGQEATEVKTTAEPANSAKPKEEPAEEWRPIRYKGCACDYEVSSLGRVRNGDYKIIAPCGDGVRVRVNLPYYTPTGEHKATTACVKNLVARAFINEALSPWARSVRHIDGDPTNNRADNLYIKTRAKEV